MPGVLALYVVPYWRSIHYMWKLRNFREPGSEIALAFLARPCNAQFRAAGKVAAEYGLAQSAVRLRPTCRHCDNYEFVIYR